MYLFMYVLQRGSTALHCASDNGNIEVCKLLMKRGLEVNAVNNVS